MTQLSDTTIDTGTDHGSCEGRHQAADHSRPALHPARLGVRGRGGQMFTQGTCTPTLPAPLCCLCLSVCFVMTALGEAEHRGVIYSGHCSVYM